MADIQVPRVILPQAAESVKVYPDTGLFAEIPSESDGLGKAMGQPLTVRQSAPGVGSSGRPLVIPSVSGVQRLTMADLLEIYRLPSHRPLAESSLMDLGAATSSAAGVTFAYVPASDEFGGSAVRIAVPAGVTNAQINIPVKPVLGGWTKALPEVVWRLKVDNWANADILYAKLGNTAMTKYYYWVLCSNSAGGDSRFGAKLGPFPGKWDGQFRSMRVNTYSGLASAGAPAPWGEYAPEFEVQAVGFTVSTTTQPLVIELNRVYSPEWEIGAVCKISDGGYQTFHDTIFKFFKDRGWPGYVSRLAASNPEYIVDAQWRDFVAAGWDVGSHTSDGLNPLTAATTPDQIVGFLAAFRRTAAMLKVQNPGMLWTQFLSNSGRSAPGYDVAGLLKSCGLTGSRGIVCDAEYGIDPWDARFVRASTIAEPSGWVPKHGRWNRWPWATGWEATPEARDVYAGSGTEQVVRRADIGKQAALVYTHRVRDVDGAGNPAVGNIGPNYCNDMLADLETRVRRGSLLPLSITQLEALTYAREGEVYLRWDGEWVSRTTGKIVI